MSTILRIARNSGYLLFGRVATKIISFFILLYIARYLGPGDFGSFSFAFAFIYFFQFIPDMGVHNVLVREISKYPERASILIGNATILKAVLSIIAFFLAFTAVYLMDYSDHVKNALYVACFGLLRTSIGAYGVIYETKLKMEYSVIFSIVSRLFFLLAVYFGIYHQLNLSFFVLASVSADYVHNLLMYVFSKKFIVASFKLNMPLIKSILADSLPIAVASVFTMIYFRIDVVMLELMKSNIDVGYYSAAYRFTEALVFVPSVFMTSVFPLMSQYFKSSIDSFAQAYVRSFKYLFATGLFLAITSMMFSENIISLLYGAEYNNSIVVLQILIWATAVMFINILLSFTYISSNNQKMIAKISAFAALFNVLMNLILIYYFSYIGAAFATFLTEMIVMVFGIYWVHKNLVSISLIRGIIYSSAGGLCVFLFLYFVRSYDIILLSPLSIFIYLVVLYYTGWLDSYDKTALKKVLKFN